MNKQLVTVVTGGGRGIGRAVAMRMAREGPVFVVGQAESHLQSVCDDIRQAGGQADYLAGDVADEAVAIAAAEKLCQLGWTVRNLVCCAGIGGGGAIETFDSQKWKRMFAVNVDGALFFIKACLPSMIEQHRGYICLMSSILGVKGFQYDTAYSATKHALVGMGRSIAKEKARHGIVTVPICPAFVDTDMTRSMIRNRARRRIENQIQAHSPVQSQAQAEAAEEQIIANVSPQKRLLQPEEIATVVASICAGHLDALNGNPLILDGGQQ